MYINPICPPPPPLPQEDSPARGWIMLREIPLSPVCPRVRFHHEREVPHGASPGLGH